MKGKVNMREMNGIKIRKELLEEYQNRIQKENLSIKLVIIQMMEDEASNLYIHNKEKYAAQVGIETEVILLEKDTKEKEVIEIIEKLNQDQAVTGILLQSPVPDHIDFQKCTEKIAIEKDVEGLTKENLWSLHQNQEKILPCTVKGILKLLEYYQISLEGKKVTIIGRSKLIGRPLMDALINRNATVSLCHSKTKDLEEYTKLADIIISAVGNPNLITKDMVKKDFIGIDVGINKVDGKLVGDFASDVAEKASYLTPVPGGVGPMTIAMVIHNLIELKNGMK